MDYSLFYSDWEFIAIEYAVVDEAADDDSPLGTESGDEKVNTDSGVTVSLEEGHEEAKADVDHYMYILKHCKERKVHIVIMKQTMIAHWAQKFDNGVPYHFRKPIPM